LPLPTRYVAEELSLGYVSSLHAADGPTVDTSDMLLSGAINSAASTFRRAPIEGRPVRGDTTKMCRTVISRGSPDHRKRHLHKRNPTSISTNVLTARQVVNVRNHSMPASASAINSTNIRHAFFILAGAVALVLTWPHAFRWMAAGGNILNPVAFFGDAMAPGGTAAFLSIDMAIAWLVFMVWVVFDSKRIGLGYKWGWIFVALSYIGVSMAFPVYLVTRERYLDKRARTDEVSTNRT
jgi:hypothetical protein